MLRPSDDMILQLGSEQAEFLAEARYADCQIVVFFGMPLGVDQRVGIDNVELHVAQALQTGGDQNIGHQGDIPVAEQFVRYRTVSASLTV